MLLLLIGQFSPTFLRCNKPDLSSKDFTSKETFMTVDTVHFSRKVQKMSSSNNPGLMHSHTHTHTSKLVTHLFPQSSHYLSDPISWEAQQHDGLSRRPHGPPSENRWWAAESPTGGLWSKWRLVICWKISFTIISLSFYWNRFAREDGFDLDSYLQISIIFLFYYVMANNNLVPKSAAESQTKQHCNWPIQILKKTRRWSPWNRSRRCFEIQGATMVQRMIFCLP